eukprot:GGOE01021546.1.p1 GENE.GGOE01021546.1~~GGOE01021546.1.p1  ORF type:complete len:249 (-),score=67.23 GGOE01021546.1:316-1062(-)
MANFEESPMRSNSPKLTKETEVAMAKRLSDESAALRDANLKKLIAAHIAKEDAARKVVKLSADKQEDSVDRLYKQSIQRKENTTKQNEAKYVIDPIKNKAKLSKDAMEDSVDKLYSQSIQRKQATEEKLNQKYLTEAPGKSLDAEQLSESVNRLYGGPKEKEEKIAALRKKYYTDPPRSKVKLDAERVKESATRLATVPREEGIWSVTLSAESRAKLEARYLCDSLPSFPKRSDDEWKSTLGRLTSPG